MASFLLEEFLPGSFHEQFVQALNTPNLAIFKYLALSFAVVGIGMDIYNIVMYAIFQRVYLAPSPLVEKYRGKPRETNILGKFWTALWGQSFDEQQQF